MSGIALMNEKCYLVLLNGTGYSWMKKNYYQWQVDSWNFPDEIKPGNVEQIQIELHRGLLTNRSDTHGWCEYSLGGTNCSFRVEVRDKPANLKVQFRNFSTPNNPKDSWIQLGWEQDAMKYFVISGKEGSFSSINPPRDWMQQNLKTLGSRPLHKICMPGTHDAGMGEITWSDHIPTDLINHFTQTQSLMILAQLEMGSRYFDIRPEISNGEQWTGHYGGKLGARGQKISSIIDDVNAFTNRCAELIILNLSHAINTDDGFRAYNQSEWNSVMREFTRLNHRFIVPPLKADDVSLLTLTELIGTGKAAVILVVEADREITIPAELTTQGFYLPSQLNVRNEYSNTTDCVEMAASQLSKMRDNMSSHDKRLFLLSWTLTQQPPQIDWNAGLGAVITKLMEWVARNPSIRTMAYSANKALMTQLLPQTSREAFPNIVYIDFLERADYAALAMAVNDRAFTVDE